MFLNHLNLKNMLQYNLRPLFRARGIDRPFTLLVRAGISEASAHRILNNQTGNFKLRHIEILCRILVCQPNDLLVWIPEKDASYPEDYPLKDLQSDGDSDGLEVFANMPLKKLQEVAKEVAEKKKV